MVRVPNYIRQRVATAAKNNDKKVSDIAIENGVSTTYVYQIIKEERIRRKSMRGIALPDPIPQEVQQQIYTMFKSGEIVADIAHKLNIADSTVRRYLDIHRGYGFHPRTQMSYSPKSKYYNKLSKVRQLAEEGFLKIQIAEELKIAPPAVSNICSALGIKPRKFSEHIVEFNRRGIYSE